jgi:predicted Zn-dependent peptidase
MDYSKCTLSNGIRIVYKKADSNVAYCGYAVDAGTRDENIDESGMAHFIEHLSFKGTVHRKAWHILNRMENVGGDLNAFTNKEETIYYSTFLVEHTPRAVDLLTDIVFHATFPQVEINKEVEVIIDEIQSYDDTPGDLIFDEFEELLFNGHPLGRNILGNPDFLRKYTTQDALAFTQRYYQPANTVFFYIGNIKFERLIRIVEHATSDLQQIKQLHQREVPGLYMPQHITKEKDTHQAHVILGNRSYSAYDKRCTALYLLNNILGGPGMNSRLNVSLRERRGLVYNVESNLTTYTDSGVFSIYFGTDVHDISTCLLLTLKELKRLRDVPLSTLQLRAAQKQLIGQLGVAEDNFESDASDMGKAILHYDKYESLTTVTDRIKELTPDILQEVAKDIFDESKLSFLIYK